MSTRKVVAYKVHGFPGEQLAGPYTDAEVEAQRADIAGYMHVYDVRVIDVTIHILESGRALCGFPGQPREWPADHIWIAAALASEANCKRCLADYQALHP